MSRRFRINSATQEVLADSARQLRRALRQQGVKVDNPELINKLTEVIKNFGQGSPNADNTPVYNQSGDTLALAYQTFAGGDIHSALHMAALAFTAEDCRPLMDAIVKCNDDASGEPVSTMDNLGEDKNEDEESPIDTSDADTVTAADRKYRQRLESAIKRVSRSIISKADADNNDNNNNDDAFMADNPLETTDSSDDNNNDNNDDITANNNNDNDEEDVPVVGDNMPPLLARVLRRVKNRPDVIAAANKISLGGSRQSRKRAIEFTRKIGNLSSTRN
jgi:hypothetical protein